MPDLSLTTIAPDETPFCGHHHKWPDEIAGYVVVLTKFGQGKVKDFRTYGATNYGVAVEDAKALRLHQIPAPFTPEVDYDYARIDVLYADGCRGIL